MRTEALEGFQLSEQQLKLWRAQSQRSLADCRTFFCVEIEGPLDIARLQQSIAAAVSRYEILRTTFQRLPGLSVPVQVIGEVPVFDFVSLSTNSENPPMPGMEPFDLENGPLVRVALRQINPNQHRLEFAISSLCADDRTACNLANEIARDYEVLSSGGEPSAGAMQYADYAAWQAVASSGPEAETGHQFWNDQLSAGADLRLPLERAPLAGRTLETGTQSIELRPELVHQLESLALEFGCPVSELLLAGWVILLGRLTQVRRVPIAVGCDGRALPELKSAAGTFARVLPVVFGFEEVKSVREFLEQLRSALRRAYDWQECFAGEKVESVANTPAWVSPVAFDYIELPEKLKGGGVSFGLSELASEGERFKIKLHCIRRGALLSANLRHDPACLQPADAGRLLEEWEATIRSLSESHETKLEELEILGPCERRQVTTEFNRGHTAMPETCVHCLFEAQVRERPDACAVVCGETQLSYRELNLRANDLAARLQKKGIGGGQAVAVCAARRVETVVAILGVLKAGGSYVPLDPSYPQERLQFMLEDTRTPILLATRELQPLRFDGEIIHLDDATQPGSHVGIPLAETRPDGDAYIIYTSGSTGRPKGVPITHRNLVNSTLARVHCYPQKVEAYLLLSSFAFDSSVAGIFWTLCQGGKLVIAPERAHQDPLEIARLIGKQGVTHLLCLPSLYRHVLESGAEALAGLRIAIVAGEACPTDLVERHRQRLPGVALYNEYGPTEATIWSTVFDCAHAELGRPVPIGKPIPNVRVYVLDSKRRPLPIGMTGEIYIGGAGVARGYLNRPEVTYEKFVVDPFEPMLDARLYRTGDLGRFLPDGNLEFLGRVDHQVKIRGYRIELEEIESVMREHPAIREAIIALQEESTGLAPQASEPEALAAALEEQPGAEELLQEVEAQSNGHHSSFGKNGDGARQQLVAPEPAAAGVATRADQWIQRRQAFEVTLDISQPGFINPPRALQRQWLINRALAEFAEDLETIHQLAEHFVHGSEFGPEDFKTDRTQARLTDDQIIESWHGPLMKAMAHMLPVGGDILEIGFGRGLAANFLQERSPRSHTIIECNDYVIADHFGPWREQHRAADIRLVRGKWQDVIAALPDFDGIFFQTYPLNEREFLDYISQSVTFAEHFFSIAAEHLRPGGSFTYLTHEIDSLSRRHQRALFRHFNSFSLSVQPLSLPEDCKDLWWADSMAVVRAVK